MKENLFDGHSRVFGRLPEIVAVIALMYNAWPTATGANEYTLTGLSKSAARMDTIQGGIIIPKNGVLYLSVVTGVPAVAVNPGIICHVET